MTKIDWATITERARREGRRIDRRAATRLAERAGDAGPRADERGQEPRALSQAEKLQEVDRQAARYRRRGLTPAQAYERALEQHPELVIA